MLQYYLPGLDVSSLSEKEFISKTAFLLRIRQMEKANQTDKLLQNLFTGE